jgi:membrane protease YdiL (CAAX protease family)
MTIDRTRRLARKSTTPQQSRFDGVKALIRRHPLGAFFLWFFTVGQAIAFTPVIGRTQFGLDLPTLPFLVAATPIGLLLPTLVITSITDGPAGLRALRRRTLTFRAPLRWYAFAVVGVPLIALAATAAKSGPPAETSATTWGSVIAVGYLLQLVLVLVTVNWWEETAWMGFVQARLQERHGPMRAAAITAVPFAFGHISLVIEDSPSAVMTFVALLLVISIPFRALLGWVYNSTGSLFLVGLVHAAANATGVGSAFGTGLLDRLYPGAGEGGVTIPLLAAVGILVIVGTHRRLGHRPTSWSSSPRPTSAPDPGHITRTGDQS